MNPFDLSAVPPANAAPEPPPEGPASTGENLVAAWKAETVRTDAWEYTWRKRTDLALRMYRLLPEDARKKVAADKAAGWMDPNNDFANLVVDEAAKHVASDPTVWAGLPLDRQQLDTYIDRQRRADFDEAQKVLDLPGGGLSEFIGASARAMTDPISIALLPLGGSGSAIRMIAQEAALGALGEAATIPRERQVARELDLPEPDVASRIAMGAAFGAGFAGLFHGAARFAEVARARREAMRSTAPEGMSPQDHEADVAGVADRMTGETSVSQTLSDEAQKARKPGPPTIHDFDFSATGNASPKSNRIGYVYGKLLERGMTPEDAAAFVGNFMVESGPGLHPGAVGDGGAALGIAQWNDRRAALMEFARKHGGRADDIDVQIDFVMHELNGSEAKAWAAIRAAKTVEEKAQLVSQLYERPGVPHMGRRVGHAVDVYHQFQGGSVPKWLGRISDASTDVPSFGTSRAYTGAGQISSASGRTIDVKYEVVDASILRRASGDMQPRDRSRAASDAWIADTAARLDPAQLMPSPNAATGTPIVGADNVIESGNGRFGAIMSAYDRFPDRAAAYRRAIEEMTGEPIPAGVERPVLVARRTSDMTEGERAQWVVDAQDSGVARMTPTEIARSSARAMTPDLMGRLDLEAGLFDPRNSHFVRAALDGLPASERNALVDASGAVNKAGQERIREALFARAWNAPDIVTRFTETEGGELKGLLDALDQAAPAWAALRADIEAGRIRPDADIGPYILEAMRLIAAARDLTQKDGVSMASAVAELLDDVDMLDGALSPLTIALVRNKFWANGRAANATEIADFLKRYAAEARKVAATDTMFSGSTADILRAIDPKVFGDLPDDLGAPRPVITRGAAPAEGPPMPEVAYAKGADSPEAIAADSVAADDLKITAAAPPLDLTGVDPHAYVRTMAMDQPFDDLDSAYVRAATAQRSLVAEGQRIADDMGIEFGNPGLKDRATTEEKILRKSYSSPRQLTDISRAGFVLKNFGQGDQLVERLAEVFDLVDEGWTLKPDTNYLDRKVIIRHPDGMLSEVQIWTPEMAKAKKAETEAYATLRALDPESREAVALVERSAAAYSAAIRGDNIDVTSLMPSATSRGPKLFAKRSENASGVSPAAFADQTTSSASTLDQGLPGSRTATAANPRSGSLSTMAGRNSQLRKPISADMGGNPSVKDNSSMGMTGNDVNSLRSEFGDLTVRLDDGTEIGVGDLIDDIEADQTLSDVLQVCNPGGQG